MRRSTVGLIILVVVLLIVLGVVYVTLFHKPSNNNQTQTNGTYNTSENMTEHKQNEQIKSTFAKMTILLKENGTVEQIELFYTNNLDVEIKIPVKTVGISQIGKYVDRILKPTTKLSKSDVINGIIFKYKNNGTNFTPEIREEILPSSSNVVNLGSITIDRYGRDLNSILKSITLPQTLNFVTVKIYDAMNGELIAVKSYPVKDGHPNIGTDFVGKEGTFRIAILVNNKAQVTYVFAGGITVINTDIAPDKRIIIYAKPDGYYLKIYSPIAKNGVDYIISFDDNVFYGKPMVIWNNEMKLSPIVIERLYNREPIYVMFKNGNKYYKAKLDPKYGIFIYNTEINTTSTQLLYPYGFSQYTTPNMKLNKTTELVVPFVIVSKYPVSVSLYDSTMNKLKYTKTVSTTIVKNTYITIVKVLMPFDEKYKKIYIKIVNGQGTIIEPILLNYDEIQTINNMTPNTIIAILKRDPDVIVSTIINYDDDSFAMLVPDDNVQLPKIYLESMNISNSTNTTNITTEDIYDVYYSVVAYIGNQSIMSYIDPDGIHIDKQFLTEYLKEPSKPAFIVYSLSLNDNIFGNYAIPVEYLTKRIVIKEGEYTYRVYTVPYGTVTTLSYDDLYNLMNQLLTSHS